MLAQQDRTARLRNRLMGHEPSVCHERAAIVTEVYERLSGTLSPILLRAHALAAVLDRMSIFIGPDELIVGNQASRPRSAPIFPEYSWEWILEELDTLPTRAADRYAVPPESREALQGILPRWRGKSFRDRAVHALPEDVLQSHHSLLFLLTSMGCGVGHLAPDYARVLTRGLSAIAREARERLTALDLTDPDTIRKRDFCQAAVVVAEAAIRFAGRFAERAEQMAAAEACPDRRAELSEIARICRKVPAGTRRDLPRGAAILLVRSSRHPDRVERPLHLAGPLRSVHEPVLRGRPDRRASRPRRRAGAARLSLGQVQRDHEAAGQDRLHRVRRIPAVPESDRRRAEGATGETPPTICRTCVWTPRVGRAFRSRLCRCGSIVRRRLTSYARRPIWRGKGWGFRRSSTTTPSSRCSRTWVCPWKRPGATPRSVASNRRCRARPTGTIRQAF